MIIIIIIITIRTLTTILIIKYDSIDNSNINDDNYSRKTIIPATIYKKKYF